MNDTRRVNDAEFGIWGASAPAAPDLPHLEGPLDCETAIVGAGYTGLSTALHLAERGESCAVIEAREPGWGASGRNTGWLEPHWWLKKPSDIDKLFGTERGRALTRWVASGPQLLDSLIGRYGLNVDIERCGLLLGTDDAAKAAAMESEAREWQAAGVQHEFLDAAGVARHIATDRYRGGLLLKQGAVLNPLALSRELARACLRAGAQIFARTPVLELSRSGNRWELRTDRGLVRCRRLVLATESYTRNLWPELERTFATWHLAVVGSQPYEMLDALLPTGVAFADMGLANIFTMRRASGGRLVTSTFATLRSPGNAALVAEPYMRKFRKIFPGRPLPAWEFAHSGEIGLSRDMMPRLAAIGPQAWTAYGYSGTGMNLALLLGAELASLVQKDDVKASCFPVTRLEPMPMRKLIGWGLRYVHGPLSRALISRIA